MEADRARGFDRPEHKDLVRRNAIAKVLTAESFFVITIGSNGVLDFHTMLDGSVESDTLLLKIYEQIKDRLPDG